MTTPTNKSKLLALQGLIASGAIHGAAVQPPAVSQYAKQERGPKVKSMPLKKRKKLLQQRTGRK